MKRTILSLAILVSISLTSFATASTSQHKGDRKEFPKELKLSDEQKTKMKEINKDFAEKIEAVKKTRIVAEVQQERIKALREEKREAIGKILTPEQKAQFEKRGDKKYSRTDKKGNKSFGRHSGMHMRQGGFKMFENLNLTDAQKEQMKGIREKQAAEHKEIAQKHKDEMMKILTPEQQKQLDENKSKFAEANKDRKKMIKKGKRNNIQ